MSDALPLPPRPNLEQYKKLAKDLQHACKSGDPGAIRDWAVRWVETLARLQGARAHARRSTARSIVKPERIEQRWQKFQKTNERAGAVHAGRRAVLRRARARLRELAEVRQARRSAGACQLAGLEVRSGGRRDRQRRLATLGKLLQRESGARAGTFDARTSLDPAALRLGERRRGLPPEDAEEHRRDHESCCSTPAPT